LPFQVITARGKTLPFFPISSAIVTELSRRSHCPVTRLYIIGRVIGDKYLNHELEKDFQNRQFEILKKTLPYRLL
jgi:hypothetical protein